MSKLTANFWVIESFRPGMRLIDPSLNKHFRSLKEAYENDTIEDHPKAKKFGQKQHSAESYNYDDREKEAMVVITADERGRFTTDDPVLARRLVDMLEAGLPLNHPVTKIAVKYEIDRYSAPIPTEDEVAKILKEREKKAP